MTFDRDDYAAWRQKRFDLIVERYGVDFFLGKSIVEVGAGYGHLGQMFAQLGADVLSTDGRVDNVEGITARFPNMRAEVCDLETSFPAGPFDFGIHTGVLYHLKNSEAAVVAACQNCRYLVLETEVTDSSDPYHTALMEERIELPDSALSGEGLRLSAAYIERVITGCGRSFMRCDSAELNSGVHRYDWVIEGTGEYGPQFRRLWFIE